MAALNRLSLPSTAAAHDNPTPTQRLNCSCLDCDFLGTGAPQPSPTLGNPAPSPSTTTMEGQKKQQWGVTSAISEAHPSKEDEKLNAELITTLKQENIFESPEGNAKR